MILKNKISPYKLMIRYILKNEKYNKNSKIRKNQ